MTDMTLLRNNQIVRNASVGTTPPHGPVKVGELPLVNVKAPPVGPPVQEGQQKPVTILPPKDADSAVKTGGLPMVKVRMTDGKPKPDNGVDEKVVIRDARHASVAAGGLPMLQVKMTQTGPQVENAPQQQSLPPQIPAAPPALSAPRSPQAAAPRAGYVARTALGAGGGYVSRALAPATGQPRTVRIAAPPVALPAVPELTTDQLMLCRHLVDKHLAELLAAEIPADAPTEVSTDVSTETSTAPNDGAESPAVVAAEPSSSSEAVQFARATIATIDDALVAIAVRAEEAAKLAAAAATRVTAAAVPAPVPTVAVAAATSIAPAPSVSHTAGRIAARSYVAGTRQQRNAGMAPRRTARQGAPLPMVEVKMDGQRAVVQNQAEIAQARASLHAQPKATAAGADTAAPDAPPPSQQG